MAASPDDVSSSCLTRLCLLPKDGTTTDASVLSLNPSQFQMIKQTLALRDWCPTQKAFIQRVLAGIPDEAGGIYVHQADSMYSEQLGTWTWTPDKENWIPCTTTTVSVGRWKGGILAAVNVQLVDWLNQHNPSPGNL